MRFVCALLFLSYFNRTALFITVATMIFEKMGYGFLTLEWFSSVVGLTFLFVTIKKEKIPCERVFTSTVSRTNSIQLCFISKMNGRFVLRFKHPIEYLFVCLPWTFFHIVGYYPNVLRAFSFILICHEPVQLPHLVNSWYEQTLFHFRHFISGWCGNYFTPHLIVFAGDANS